MKKTIFETDGTGKFNKTEVNQYGQRLYELMTLKKKKTLKQEEVVEDAKNPDTPYHNYFEWDNKIAGHHWRLNQAGELLRSIKIKVEVESGDTPRNVRVFHNVVRKGERCYAPLELVFQEQDLREQVIHNALAEAENWYQKYHTYQELQPISAAIKKTKKKVTA